MEKTKINRFVSDIFDVGSTVDIFVTESMSVAELAVEWKMIRDDIALTYQRSFLCYRRHRVSSEKSEV